MNKKVLIVGAGPGGLAAAMLLAAQGIDVQVFESRSQVGGRTSRFDQQGFRFDRGPTFFLYPKIIRQIFQQCGFDFDRMVELVRLDPLYEIVFENCGSIRATQDLEQFKDQIGQFSRPDSENLRAYLADNRAKFDQFQSVLQRPFNGYKDLLRWDLLRSLPSLRITKSVDQDLARFFSNEKVRLAFSFQSKYLGMSPFNCPSLFTILSFMEHEFGVFHPIGGCSAVIDAMAQAAQEMGVKIHLRDGVRSVRFKGRKFDAIETESGRVRGDALVVNADFSHFMNRYIPQSLLRTWNREKLRKKRYSCSTFMMYLGLRGALPELEHHTIFLTEDYRGNLEEIEKGGKPPKYPSFYIQNACHTDRSLAPEGHSALYVLVPVANQSNPIDWRKHTSTYRHLIFQRLKKLGLGDIEKRIVVEKICTPEIWQDEYSIHLGATFNLTHSLDQMLLWRPRNRFEELDNVYLVGGGTHPGSGLPVIFEGARITADLLGQDLGCRRIDDLSPTDLVTADTSPL